MVAVHGENNYRYEFCPLCASADLSCIGKIEYVQPVIFSTNEVELNLIPELWRCCNCASWFVQNIFSAEQAKDLYSMGDAGERWSREPFELQKHHNILDTLERSVSGNGIKLLDVGCNTGELLDFVKERGCLTSGVEFSSASKKVLFEKGHQVYTSMEDVNEQFDVITAFDLIEHLYDIPKFFSECRRLLNDNGKLIILTGNISSISARLCRENWWYLKYPEHIVFPSRKLYQIFSGFHLKKWIPTYASLPYQQPFSSMIRGVVSGVLNKNYSGLPSLGPDHALIVLKK